MNSELVYRIFFFGIFIAFLAIRGIFGWKAKQSGLNIDFQNDDPETPAERKPNLIGIVIAVSILVLFVLYAIIPGDKNILIVFLPGWIHGLGIGLGIISLALQIWTHSTLQENWCKGKQNKKDEILITEGPYHWARHPLYFALILLISGLSFISSYISFLLLAIISLPFFHNAAKKEEAIMMQQCQAEYGKYMKSTGRILPRLHKEK
jgi:protein-S-isoprenylcysteine O-methyltransferase Ste14